MQGNPGRCRLCRCTWPVPQGQPGPSEVQCRGPGCIAHGMGGPECPAGVSASLGPEAHGQQFPSLPWALCFCILTQLAGCRFCSRKISPLGSTFGDKGVPKRPSMGEMDPSLRVYEDMPTITLMMPSRCPDHPSWSLPEAREMSVKALREQRTS